MKTTKRALSLILALVVILSIAVPAFAETTNYPIWPYFQDEPVILYRSNNSGESVAEFSLAWRAQNFTIKRSSIKVTPGTAGASFKNLYKCININNYEQEKFTSINEGYYYQLAIKVANKGSAKVSFKAGGETYSIKIKVLNYENPLKSLKITGIKNGKNIASMIKNGYDYDNPKTVVFNSAIKSVKLNAAAATGWAIKQIGIQDITTGQYRVLGGDNGVKNSATINWGTLNVKHNYMVYMTLYNTANNFTMHVNYNLKGALAA